MHARQNEVCTLFQYASLAQDEFRQKKLAEVEEIMVQAQARTKDFPDISDKNQPSEL
jgi:hypothetical protein